MKKSLKILFSLTFFLLFINRTSAQDLQTVIIELDSTSFTTIEIYKDTYAYALIDVPEITEEIYNNGTVSAFILRPSENPYWSVLPQVFFVTDPQYSFYYAYGIGFVRFSFQVTRNAPQQVKKFYGAKIKLVLIKEDD